MPGAAYACCGAGPSNPPVPSPKSHCHVAVPGSAMLLLPASNDTDSPRQSSTGTLGTDATAAVSPKRVAVAETTGRAQGASQVTNAAQSLGPDASEVNRQVRQPEGLSTPATFPTSVPHSAFPVKLVSGIPAAAGPCQRCKVSPAPRAKEMNENVRSPPGSSGQKDWVNTAPSAAALKAPPSSRK